MKSLLVLYKPRTNNQLVSDPASSLGDYSFRIANYA